MTSSNEIYGRMAAVLADVGAIEKTRKNQAQGFQFRGIDDAMNELHGTFAKHAIFLTHEVRHHTMTERETRNGGKSFHHLVEVQFTFWAPDGSSVSAVGIGEAADTGDKGAGKAMAYALKVCLLQTFLIPTEEEKDPDYRITEWQGKAAGHKGCELVSANQPIPDGVLTDRRIVETQQNPTTQPFRAPAKPKTEAVAKSMQDAGLNPVAADLYPLFIEGRDNDAVVAIMKSQGIDTKLLTKHGAALKKYLSETRKETDLLTAIQNFFMSNK